MRWRWRRPKHECPPEPVHIGTFVIRRPTTLPDVGVTVVDIVGPIAYETVQPGKIVRFIGTNREHQIARDHFNANAYDLSEADDVKLLLQEQRQGLIASVVETIRSSGAPT